MFEEHGYMLMFRAGEKFYFWDRIDRGVVEIVSPDQLDEILVIMREKGTKGLKVKRLA